MMQFTPEIWKWHAVLHGIHAGNHNTNILQRLDVNLRTVQRIQNKFGVHIILSGVVASDCDFIPPLIFPHSFRLNKCLLEIVLTWIERVLFTNPSARAGYDTRSIFKRSLTGLNSEFSFS